MMLQHVLAAQYGVAQSGVTQSGDLVPAGTDRIDPAGRGLAGGTRAWSKVFEAQQTAALDRFRSVGNAVAVPPAQRGLPGQQTLQDRPAQAVARSLPGPAMKAMPGAGASQPAIAAIPAAPVRPNVEGASRVQQALQSAASASVLCGASSEASGAAARMPQIEHCRQLAAILEKLTGKQWPRKNIHVAATAEGVYVWLRDSAPAHDPDSVARLAAGVRAVFRESGNPLAGMSLNGIRII
jgi:hypothetical protein